MLQLKVNCLVCHHLVGQTSNNPIGSVCGCCSHVPNDWLNCGVTMTADITSRLFHGNHSLLPSASTCGFQFPSKLDG